MRGRGVTISFERRINCTAYKEWAMERPEWFGDFTLQAFASTV